MIFIRISLFFTLTLQCSNHALWYFIINLFLKEKEVIFREDVERILGARPFQKLETALPSPEAAAAPETEKTSAEKRGDASDSAPEGAADSAPESSAE